MNKFSVPIIDLTVYQYSKFGPLGQNDFAGWSVTLKATNECHYFSLSSLFPITIDKYDKKKIETYSLLGI